MNTKKIRPGRFSVKINRRSAVMLGAAAIVLVILLFSLLSGCGVRHSSPRGVVHSLLEAYAKGNERRVRDCYGQKKEASESLQAEIDSMLAYLEAHNTKDIHIQETDVLWENDTYTCEYVLYVLELDSGQEYPCLGIYVTENKSGKYYILPPADITQTISSRTAEAYTKFMTTDIYKDYAKAYNTFVKKNPGYEEKIAARLGE